MVVNHDDDEINKAKKLTEELRNGSLNIAKRVSSRTGFEPVRENPIGFRVQRLNHSAIVTVCASWQGNAVQQTRAERKGVDFSYCVEYSST